MGKKIVSGEVSESTRWKIRLMAMNGFYARTICDKLRAGFWANLSVGQIYRVLKQEGISLRAYREGWGEGAADRFKELKLGGTLPERKRTKRGKSSRTAQRKRTKNNR